MALYFPDVDSAGHKFGPKSNELKNTVLKVDQTLGILFSKIKKLKLPINIVVVSDHGMQKIDRSQIEYLDPMFSQPSEQKLLKKFKVIGYGPIMHLYYQGSKGETDLKKFIQIFNKKAKFNHAYLRRQIPSNLHYKKDPRIGDILIMSTSNGVIEREKSAPTAVATHGYDPIDNKNMHGIFYAAGPLINQGKIETVDNVHIYPLLARLLDLKINEPIDGELKKVESFLIPTLR